MRLDLRSRGLSATARAGGALVMTLIVAGVVAILSAAILQLTMGYTRKEVYVEHDTRAFYLAEAGIAEAYRSLAHGGTGQIGSRTAPAGSGDGLLWVDATERADGVVELECTALVGLGRASLAIVVDRDEVPVGFFSNTGITITAPIMADGYDSEHGPYIEQAVPDPTKLKKVALDNFIAAHGDVWPYTKINHNGTYWLLVERTDTDVYVQALDTSIDTVPTTLEPAPSTGGGFTFLDTALTASSDETLVTSSAADPDLALRLGDLPHTDQGARIVSNGAIRIDTTDAHIFGDVIPGPNMTVTALSGSTISGSTAPREQVLALDPIVVPSRTLDGAVDHASLVPWVVPEGDSGYQGLRVRAGSEVILRGPATIVLGSLELEAGATLAIENAGGTVLLYVLGDVSLALGSTVEVQSDLSSRLNLLGAGTATKLDLFATSRFHGLIYAPEAAVTIGTEFEVFGAALADSLSLSPGARLHFDSSATSGAVQLPRLIFWQVSEIPADIAARRADARQLLGIDETTLADPVDLTESHSWTARIVYWTSGGGKKGGGGPIEAIYEGPFEEFSLGAVQTLVSIELTPPDVTHAAPWTARIEYRVAATWQTFEGPLSDFGCDGISWIDEIHLTPPDELLAKGFAPTSVVW